MIGMVYSISGCFPSSGAATMNTLTNRISAGPGRPRVSGSRCSFCGLCTGDYEESAGVPKGVVVCADAAWMCCDDPVGVPEELLPRGELRVATQRRYPPLQDGHRGRKVGGDVDVARQVLYYYRPVNRVPPGTSRAVEGGGCRDRDVVFLPRNSFTIRLFPFHLVSHLCTQDTHQKDVWPRHPYPQGFPAPRQHQAQQVCRQDTLPFPPSYHQVRPALRPYSQMEHPAGRPCSTRNGQAQGEV